MATVIPAIRGRMGSTEFYEAKISAVELCRSVRPASELDDWTTMGIEERMQRDPDMKRIMTELAPYIAKSADRFFGSVIVLIYKGDVTFEGIKDFQAKLPRAYQTQADDMGFLTMDGGTLIMLDGQHRLLALRTVLDPKNGVQGPYLDDVPQDDVCVIFIKHESNEKTRRIFNKTNRYAKQTSRSDNIITSEDDGYAIVARRLLNEGNPLGVYVDKDKKEIVVDWKNNSLADRSVKFTTLATVYETVKLILDDAGVTKLDEALRPSDEDLEDYTETACMFWKTILNGLTPYRDALEKPTAIPKMRQENEPYSLLFKPAAQVALIQGLTLATRDSRLSLAEAVERANKVDWRITSPIWRDVIIRANNAIDPKKEARERAARLIWYLIAADKMTPKEIEGVKKVYNKARGYDLDNPPIDGAPEELPTPVVEDGAAETAPEPVAV